MVFVDASALITIITGEPEAADLADVLDAERLRLCSALSVWQTVAGLCHSHTFSVPAARATTSPVTVTTLSTRTPSATPNAGDPAASTHCVSP